MFFSRKPSSGGLFKRLFKFVFSVLVLTAFIVSLSLGIKAISTLDSNKLSSYVSKVANKVGISGDKAGMVAGLFVDRVTDVSINPSERIEPAPEISATNTAREDVAKKDDTARQKLTTVALVSDIHDDLAGLTYAIEKMKAEDIKIAFLLGDLTDFGVLDNLKSVKKVLESSGITFYVLPGDHDLYKSVGSQNFIEVFGDPNNVVTEGDLSFILLDNSANFTPISEENMRWFNSQLPNASFVLLSQPIYQESVSVLSPIMGVVNGEENKEVKAQGQLILSMIRESKVKAIIAGDHHRSSETPDPERGTLEHVVIGAISPYRNLQSARFSVMDVYDDGSYKLREILLD